MTLVDSPQKEPISTRGAWLGRRARAWSMAQALPPSSMPALAKRSQVRKVSDSWRTGGASGGGKPWRARRTRRLNRFGMAVIGYLLLRSEEHTRALEVRHKGSFLYPACRRAAR